VASPPRLEALVIFVDDGMFPCFCSAWSRVLVFSTRSSVSCLAFGPGDLRSLHRRRPPSITIARLTPDPLSSLGPCLLI